MALTPRHIGSTAVLIGLIAAALVWRWHEGSRSSTHLSARWMELADTDGDGSLSEAEYTAVWDGVTPISVLDINSDAKVDPDELHAFMMEADPVKWMNLTGTR